MEIADFAGSVTASLAVQRAEKGPGGYQPEGPDRQEADGIIDRTVYAEVPPRVEYALNDLGETLRPILDAMEVWGMDYQNIAR